MGTGKAKGDTAPRSYSSRNLAEPTFPIAGHHLLYSGDGRVG